jgi:hypothetical protein
MAVQPHPFRPQLFPSHVSRLRDLIERLRALDPTAPIVAPLALALPTAPRLRDDDFINLIAAQSARDPSVRRHRFKDIDIIALS